LTDVTVNWTTPLSIDGNVFLGISPSNNLHVPDGSLSTYQAAAVWKEFGTIVEASAIANPVTGVTISDCPASTLNVGGTAQLTATVIPSDAINKAVRWESSDPSVATVSEETGLVTAKAEGWATITVTTVDGNKTATCTVTVKKDNSAIEEVDKEAFKVYPNPVGDELYIQSALQIKKVEIYSLAGALLFSDNHFTERISMRNFADGVYLVRIYTDKGSVVSKVVKK
jgi:hypothetical protein